MQSLEEMHKIAEDNKREIEDIKANPQDFFDSCFLEAFKITVSNFFQTYLKECVVRLAEHGKTSFKESFGLSYLGLIGQLLNGESAGVGAICVCFDAQERDFPKIVWELDSHRYISSEQQKLLYAAGIWDYVVSLEAIKGAYEIWLDAIKSAGLTIVRADDFELSKEEYKKLTRKSLLRFEKVFNAELSF